MRRSSITVSILEVSGAGTAAQNNIRTNYKSTTGNEVLTYDHGIAITQIRSGENKDVLTPSLLPSNATSFCYSVPNNPDCEGLQNNAGSVLDYWSYSNIYRTQFFTTYASSNLYFRTQNGDNNGTWNTWCKVYHTGYKPSAQDANAFQGSTIDTVDAGNVAWNAYSGLYNERMMNPQTGTVSYTSILLHFYQRVGSSTPALQIRSKYRNGGLWYRSSRDAAGFEEPFTEIFTEKRPPTPEEVGIVKNMTFPSISTRTWVKIGSVNITQGRGNMVALKFAGSSGFNVGQSGQASSTELYIRPGNANPKGITLEAYTLSGDSGLFYEIAWKNTTGDTYEIYANVNNYTGEASVLIMTTKDSTADILSQPIQLSAKPADCTDGNINTIFHSGNQQSALPVGIVYSWMGASAPAGFTFVHGQSFDKTANPKLAALLPSGVLPDTRGMVLKGIDGGRSILSIEQDGIKSHTHGGTAASTDLGTKSTNETGNHSHGINGAYTAIDRSGGSWVDGHYANHVFHNTNGAGNHSHTVYIGAHSHTLTIDATGNVENTVKNLGINYIVQLG